MDLGSLEAFSLKQIYLMINLVMNLKKENHIDLLIQYLWKDNLKIVF